jgi:nucleoside 2-deoxyribosyltransferase
VSPTSPSVRPVVYLAGPEVFLAEGLELAEAKKALCRDHGFEGLAPTDDPEGRPLGPEPDGHEIFHHCVAHMERSDLVIANMTPFRGPSMDVGTAVEVGFMHARGRPVFGYTNVVHDYGERVEPDGMQVEAFGFFDNLMCEGPLFASGATIVRTEVGEDGRFSDLRGFEGCLAQAAAQLLG